MAETSLLEASRLLRKASEAASEGASRAVAPVFSALADLSRKVDLVAEGVGLSLREASAAKDAALEVKRLEEEEAAKEALEEAQPEVEEPEPVPEPKVVERFLDGRVKSVRQGERTAKVNWNSDGTVRSITYS